MNLFLQLIVVMTVISAALAGRAAPVVVKDKNLIEKGTELVQSLTKGHVSCCSFKCSHLLASTFTHSF